MCVKACIGHVKALRNCLKIRRDHMVKPYTDIINNCWDKMLHHSIYASAYWLNLTFQYDQKKFCQKSKIMLGLLDIIKIKVTESKIKLLDEIRLFREYLKNFGRSIAIISCKTIRLDKNYKFTSL